MKALTNIQAQVLEYLIGRIETRRLPPTHREIADHFKWTSNAAAKSHLLALEKKGFIVVHNRLSRGIELVQENVAKWRMARASGNYRDASFVSHKVFNPRASRTQRFA